MPRTKPPKKVVNQAARFDAWLWGAVADGTATTLPDAYRELHDPENPEQITVLTVLAEDDPASLLDRYANLRTWTARAGNVGAVLVEVDDESTFVVTSWPTSQAGVFHLAATVPVTDSRWARVERWLKRSAPAVVPIYLDRRSFEGFVSVFGEFGTVDASRLTGRYRTDQSSYNRGWPNPKPALEALEEVDETVQLRTMTLAIISEPGSEVELRVHLRRKAGATFYSGDFALFDRVVLERLVDAVARRGELFSGRARIVGQPAHPPVEVRIGAERFDLPDAGSDFFHRLSTYASADTAILHRNPYMHVAVTDYLDGSNFDLFVTDVDRIVIHPGYASSVGALVRLTTFLSEEFEADAVAEQAARGPVALEDLFAPHG